MPETTNEILQGAKLFNNTTPIEKVLVKGRRPRNSPPDTPPPVFVQLRPVFTGLEDVMRLVPSDTLYKLLYNTVLIPAAEEATEKALDKEGTLNPVLYEQTFLQALSPRVVLDRAQVKEQLEEKTRKLVELLSSVNLNAFKSEAERQEFMKQVFQLQLEIKDLQQRLVKRTRKVVA